MWEAQNNEDKLWNHVTHSQRVQESAKKKKE